MSTPEAGAANPRFPLFDSLRALAALSVFAVHLPFGYRMAPGNPLRPYLLNLNVGVAVFFLISGFLLYRPFARARLGGARGPALRPYAVRRLLRIVPAYWVALPCVVLLLGPSGEGLTATRVFSAHGVPAYFGFAQVYDSHTLLGGISAAWSLCVELSFYALLPLWALLMLRLPCLSARGFLRSELLGLAVLFAIGRSGRASRPCTPTSPRRASSTPRDSSRGSTSCRATSTTSRSGWPWPWRASRSPSARRRSEPFA